MALGIRRWPCRVYHPARALYRVRSRLRHLYRESPLRPPYHDKGRTEGYTPPDSCARTLVLVALPPNRGLPLPAKGVVALSGFAERIAAGGVRGIHPLPA